MSENAMVVAIIILIILAISVLYLNIVVSQSKVIKAKLVKIKIWSSGKFTLVFIDMHNKTHSGDFTHNLDFYEKHIGDWFLLKIRTINGEIIDVAYEEESR